MTNITNEQLEAWAALKDVKFPGVPGKTIVSQLAAALLTERDATIEKLRAAISWIEPPFIDENTSEAELRKRISFCVEDAKKALKGQRDE